MTGVIIVSVLALVFAAALIVLGLAHDACDLPAVRKHTNLGTTVYVLIIGLLIALWALGNLPGADVLPGFGWYVATLFVAFSVIVPAHALRYARSHIGWHPAIS